MIGVVIVGWLLLQADVSDPEFLIRTGNTGIVSTRPNQSILAVGRQARVRVNDQQQMAYVDIGEVVVTVPPGLPTPFVVETRGVRAIVRAQSKFRVTVSATVIAFEVYSGEIELYHQNIERGREPPPARHLKPGDNPYRVIDA